MKEVKELGRKLDEPRSDSSKGGVDQIIWHLPMGEQDLHVRAGEESNNCEAESKHDSSRCRHLTVTTQRGTEDGDEEMALNLVS